MAYETHYDKYNELKSSYKIKRGTHDIVSYEQRRTMTYPEINKAIEEATEQYDIVVEYIGSGYAHMKYRVVKNKPNLSMKDLAIICDEGNLCFGHRVESGLICVYTD